MRLEAFLRPPGDSRDFGPLRISKLLSCERPRRVRVPSAPRTVFTTLELLLCHLSIGFLPDT
jgi:hypothetical protein